MNVVTLIGRMTRDSELKYTANGTPVINFSIALNEYQGEEKGEITHFFECFAFGKRWEKLNSYLVKGTKIAVNGSLSFEQWVDKQGSKRSTVKIKVSDIEFCGSKNSGNNNSTNYNNNNDYSSQSSAKENSIPTIDINDEEIPF